MSQTGETLGLGEPLRRIVSKKFQAAYRNKDLLFSDTTLALLRTKGNAPFQLRYCAALAQKPQGDGTKSNKGSKRSTGSKGPKADPFEDPPEDLLVARIPSSHASHVLILNKFPVIQNHFIIATTANKPQTDFLEEDDIRMTWACLRAWQEDQENRNASRLFAFFNSGEHSGASQVHRHLQFLSVEDMSGSEPQDWGLLMDRMTTPAHPELPLFQDPTLPFLHFSTPIENGLPSSTLYSKYLLLMKAALSATQFPDQPLVTRTPIQRGRQTVFSYNLSMTTERMAICPRSSEAARIPAADCDGSVALNGTILAGTLMVKHEAEWDTLRQDPSLLDDILSSIGYPMVSWRHVEETTKL